jgi:hypothetical protein
MINRKMIWGSRLLALAYLAAAVTPVENLIRRNDPTHHQHMDAGTALVVIVLSAVEIMIALAPVRRGERWALVATMLPMIVVGIPRLVTDPACQLYDLSHHGCHQVMIAMTLGFIGWLLSCVAGFSKRSAIGTAA